MAAPVGRQSSFVVSPGRSQQQAQTLRGGSNSLTAPSAAPTSARDSQNQKALGLPLPAQKAEAQRGEVRSLASRSRANLAQVIDSNQALPLDHIQAVPLGPSRSGSAHLPTTAATRRSSPSCASPSAGSRSPGGGTLSRSVQAVQLEVGQVYQPSQLQQVQQPQPVQSSLAAQVQVAWSPSWNNTARNTLSRNPSQSERSPSNSAVRQLAENAVRQLSDGRQLAEPHSGSQQYAPRQQKTPRPRKLDLSNKRGSEENLRLPPWRVGQAEARDSQLLGGRPALPSTPGHPPSPSQGSPALSTTLSQSSLLAGNRETGWQAGLRQVRQELQLQRASTVEGLAEEARTRRQELELQQAALSRASAEQVSTVRFEVDLAMREEREARLGEVAELRGALEMLRSKVADCQAALVARPTDHRNSDDEVLLTHRMYGGHGGQFGQLGQMQAAASAAQAVEGLVRELDAERVSRCSKDADIHMRIGREVSDLGMRLEAQYRTLFEEIKDTSRQMEERRLSLEKVVSEERQLHAHESHELRAMVENMWQRVSAAGVAKNHTTSSQEKPTYFFRYNEGPGEESYKAVMGDEEDINTLYEMVREALGDTVSLRQEIAEERESRKKDQAVHRQNQDRLERSLNTIQAVLHQATPLSARDTPVLSGTPSTSVPTSPTLNLRDPTVEVVRNELRARMEAYTSEILGDVTSRLEQSEASLRKEMLNSVEEVREQLGQAKRRNSSHRHPADIVRETLTTDSCSQFQDHSGRMATTERERVAGGKA